jgi:hypothetical protein
MNMARSQSERHEACVDFYLFAKSIVLGEGFGHEVSWQDGRHFGEVTETVFLGEAAWVVLSSGMRETVVRNKFTSLSAAFNNWASARDILEHTGLYRRNAFRVFGHARKIDSIIQIATEVDRRGFECFKEKILEEGVSFLQSLPYIGPATSYHLAKNLGLDVVKPDRHLLRIAALLGYDNPADFCKAISTSVGDRVSVVDVVVWRYATLNPGYKDFLARCFVV